MPGLRAWDGKGERGGLCVCLCVFVGFVCVCACVCDEGECVSGYLDG